MQGSILRAVGALERQCGCLDRSCAVLQRDEFGLDVSEFGAQADLAVEEAFADSSGYVQYSVSPIVDQSQWPTKALSGSTPVINVQMEQKTRDFMETQEKRQHPAPLSREVSTFPAFSWRKWLRIHGSRVSAAKTRGSRAPRLLLLWLHLLLRWLTRLAP